MSFNYAGSANTAQSLLSKFGQSISLVRASDGGSYDPVTGSISGGVTQTWVGVGAVFDYKQNEINGSNILVGDRKVYIGPNIGAVPKTSDKLTLASGQVLRVMASMPLSPAGIVILHEVQCRGL